MNHSHNLFEETFNDFFIHIGSKLASEIDGQLPNESDPEGIINSNIPHLNRFEFSTISQEEVYTELCNLKESKSTGLDTIPSRVLKISASIIAPSITWILNLSLKKGIFVDEWKKLGSYQFINLAIDIIAKIIDLFQYYLL